MGILKKIFGGGDDDRKHITGPIPESNKGQRKNASTSRKRGGSPGAGGAGHGEKPKRGK